MDRITWVDNMKAFSIMAVVLNHTHIMPDIKSVVYLTCLPAFFFTAGLFTNTTLSPIDFFKKKTTRLLIPYFVFGLISWLAWLVIGRNYGSDSESFVKWWLPIVGLLGGKEDMLIANPPLWFLCCMISLEWIYYWIYRLQKKRLRWIIITLLTLIGCIASYWRQNWIWEISTAFIILPLYALGAEFRKQIQEKSTSYGLTTLLFILLLSIIIIWFGARYNAGIALHKSYIGNPLIYYPSILSVIGLWGVISLLLVKYCGLLRGLSYIGQNTLLILCVHIPVFGIIKGIAILCHISLEFFETTIGCLCLWAGSFAIILPAAYVINRFIPWVLGKK